MQQLRRPFGTKLAVIAWIAFAASTMATITHAGDAFNPADYFEVDRKGEPNYKKPKVGNEENPFRGDLRFHRDDKKTDTVTGRSKVNKVLLAVSKSRNFEMTGSLLERNMDLNAPVERIDQHKGRPIVVVGFLRNKMKKNEKIWYIDVREYYEDVKGTYHQEKDKKKTIHKIADDLGKTEYTLIAGNDKKAFARFIEKLNDGDAVHMWGSFNRKVVKKARPQKNEPEVLAWELVFHRDPNEETTKTKKAEKK